MALLVRQGLFVERGDPGRTAEIEPGSEADLENKSFAP
jgi:hypothetical protein